MELTFEERRTPFLQPVLRQTCYQEESAEMIVPDSMADMDRVLTGFGTPLLRSKECRDGQIVVSGGVNAGAMFVAEGEQRPRTLEAYIPFTVKVEQPGVTDGAAILADCRLRSAEARMLNSRKAVVRVGIVVTILVLEPAELTWYAPPEIPAGVQTRVKTCQMEQIVAAGERTVLVSESVELPQGQPAIAELCKWSAALEITEKKVIGNRAVFKGTAQVRLLYWSDGDQLCSWSFEMPFSQFAELDAECGEETPELTLVLTGAELHPDGAQPWRAMTAELNVLVQCQVRATRQMEYVDDLYGTREQLTPQFSNCAGEALLDRQTLRQSGRQTMSCAMSEVLDTGVLLDVPEVSRRGDTAAVTCRAQASVLYYDGDHALQGAVQRLELSCETALAEGCVLRPAAKLSGDAFAAPVPDGGEVRLSVDFTLESYADAACQMVSGCSSEPYPAGEKQPSVVIREVEETESLWAVAKAYRTTVPAICAANGLETEELPTGRMLLIPRA